MPWSKRVGHQVSRCLRGPSQNDSVLFFLTDLVWELSFVQTELWHTNLGILDEWMPLHRLETEPMDRHRQTEGGWGEQGEEWAEEGREGEARGKQAGTKDARGNVQSRSTRFHLCFTKTWLYSCLCGRWCTFVSYDTFFGTLLICLIWYFSYLEKF